jgi:hypothetical protein
MTGEYEFEYQILIVRALTVNPTKIGLWRLVTTSPIWSRDIRYQGFPLKSSTIFDPDGEFYEAFHGTLTVFQRVPRCNFMEISKASAFG